MLVGPGQRDVNVYLEQDAISLGHASYNTGIPVLTLNPLHGLVLDFRLGSDRT